MSLESGKKLGTFEITGLLGKGGMGEVYRARDSKLDRDVAIKVLPEGLASDAERLERFEREAKMLAALDHPNIGALYDFQNVDGVRFLVLQLVEGETLQERIDRGPIPLLEALPLFIQIGEALEAAHTKNIIHRDLKPGNIQLTPDGVVKVLDFGLARPTESVRPSAVSLSDATVPSDPNKVTTDGSILGTPSYMSPEQARGFDIDQRSDIWAFGCCLYEALTGTQPFPGDTAADTLAKVLEREPDWEALPTDTPMPVRYLIQNCLDKDPRNRPRDIGDIRIQLRRLITDSGKLAATPQSEKPSQKSLLPAALACAVLIVCVVGLFIVRYFDDGAPLDSDVAVHQGTAPSGPEPLKRTPLSLNPRSYYADIAISPDGTQLAYITADQDGVTHLAIGRIGDLEGRVLSGTSGARDPFFSPDGESIGYVSRLENKMKQIRAAGGTPVEICDGFYARLNASWGEDGFIIFSSHPRATLHRVHATGGVPEPITTLDMTPDRGLHSDPHVLPGGAGVFFTAFKSRTDFETPAVYVLTPEGEARPLPLGEFGNEPLYASAGYVVYRVAYNHVFARRFDLATLEVGAESFLISESRLGGGEQARYDLSRTGALAYVAYFADASAQTNVPHRKLVWVDLKGSESLPLPIQPKLYERARISPDGSRIALGDGSDLFVYDIERKRLTTLANDTPWEVAPVWNPKGTEIAYASGGPWNYEIHTKRADGTGGVTQLRGGTHPQFPHSWSSDGSVLTYEILEDGWDVAMIRLGTDAAHTTEFAIQTPAGEGASSISPDGHWVAYDSDESGTMQVYVTAFPSFEGKWMVSVDGGQSAAWAPDTSAIFYRDGATMMRVPVETEPAFKLGNAELLWERDYRHSGESLWRGRVYDIHPDGDRFLMIKYAEDEVGLPPSDDIIVVENLFDNLNHDAPISGGN